jgi:hypothetical protein
MSSEQNYNDLLKENKRLSNENKKNKERGNKRNNDLDKFNSLIDQAAEAITCDANCQKQKKTDELKQKYITAQSNLARGPQQVETARKNYVIYNKGEPVYNQLVETELTKKATMISTFFENNFNEESKNVLSDVKTYSGLLSNLKNVFELYLKYKQENVELTKKLKEETNDILTNERKTYYQEQGIDNLKFYYYYFLLIVYVICVILFGVFNFIYPSQMSGKIRAAILVILLILPFISTWILGKLVMMIYGIYGLLPTNVHKTL